MASLITADRGASAFAKVHLHRHLITLLGAKAEARRAATQASSGGEGSGAAHHASPSIGSSGGEGSGGEGSFVPVPGVDAGCGDGLLTVEDLADALREAFLTTDAHFMRSSSSQAGSTAVAALVTGTYVVVANAGDSRCVLWREGRVLPLSVDHKPDRPDELQRIKDAGGWVAHGRVLHILAVARALGDRDFKYEATLAAGMPITADLVSASPEVRPNQVPIKFQSSSSLSPSPSMHALTTAPSPPHRCASAVCSRATSSSSRAMGSGMSSRARRPLSTCIRTGPQKARSARSRCSSRHVDCH